MPGTLEWNKTLLNNEKIKTASGKVLVPSVLWYTLISKKLQETNQEIITGTNPTLCLLWMDNVALLIM